MRSALEAAAKLGIYVQVPFCQTKCAYCNFHTGVFSPAMFAPYVGAVCRELAEHAVIYRAAGVAADEAVSGNCVVDTIYVGGGTPSLLEPAALARILDAVRGTFSCVLAEVTLEAEPETVTPNRAAAWRAAGFDRVSLGVQSFHDSELKAAGRMHRRRNSFEALRMLREAGFRNVSCDLIAGLPHQTASSWDDSLDALLGLRPEHVSIYMLEIDEESHLGREVLSGGVRFSAGALPDENSVAAFYERASERLAAQGFRHYEISNWALAGFESRHNLKYWRRLPYLGFGAGAHSFNGRDRWANAHDPARYVAAIVEGRLPVEQLEELTPKQALEEELFLGLRQLEGIDWAQLEGRYRVRLAPRLEKLREAGLIEMEATRARLATARLAVSNEVFVELLG